jgi:hypothetical protein
MKVFVSYGYNPRDRWIEEQVFPILRNMGFSVGHGKNGYGEELSGLVKERINQSDAAIGFFTIREGQETADFNSHPWVLNEMVYADAKGKSLIPVKEVGVRIPGQLQNLVYIPLDQNDRLACVVAVVAALGQSNIRRLILDPGNDDQLRMHILQWLKSGDLVIQYQTRNEEGIDSSFRVGRLEMYEAGFYLNVTEVPKKALLCVEGFLKGEKKFISGWVLADASKVPIY